MNIKKSILEPNNFYAKTLFLPVNIGKWSSVLGFHNKSVGIQQIAGYDNISQCYAFSDQKGPGLEVAVKDCKSCFHVVFRPLESLKIHFISPTLVLDKLHFKLCYVDFELIAMTWTTTNYRLEIV